MRKTLETTQFFAELGQKLSATKKMYPGSICDLLTDSVGETAHDIKDTVYSIETIMKMIRMAVGKSKRNDPVTDVQEGDTVVIVRGLTGRVSVTLQIYTRNESGGLQLKRVYEGASTQYETRIVFEAEPIPLPAPPTTDESNSKGTDMNNAKTVDFTHFVEMIDDAVTKCKGRKRLMPVMSPMYGAPGQGFMSMTTMGQPVQLSPMMIAPGQPLMFPQPTMQGLYGQGLNTASSPSRTIVLVNYESDRVNEIVSGLAKTLTKTHSLWIVTSLQGLSPTVDGDIFISIGDPDDKPNGSLGVSVTHHQTYIQLTEFVADLGHVFRMAGAVKGSGEVDIIANLTVDHPDAKPEVKFTQTKETTDDFIESNLKRLQLAVAKVGANLYIFMEMNGYERKIDMSKSVDVETLSPDSFGTLVSKAEAFIAVVEKAGYRIVLTLTAMVEDTNTPSRNRKHCFTNG